jgi:hypothetical protein
VFGKLLQMMSGMGSAAGQKPVAQPQQMSMPRRGGDPVGSMPMGNNGNTGFAGGLIASGVLGKENLPPGVTMQTKSAPLPGANPMSGATPMVGAALGGLFGGGGNKGFGGAIPAMQQAFGRFGVDATHKGVAAASQSPLFRALLQREMGQRMLPKGNQFGSNVFAASTDDEQERF